MEEGNMLTSSGPICDVCGKYILPFIDPDERVHIFSVTGIDRDLHCDNACKEKVLKCWKDALKDESSKGWKLLPEGPLRKAFEDQEKEINNEY
jgi:hypothetical protein